MPELSKLNAVAIGDVAKVDAVLKANIANILGLTLPSGAAFLLDTYTGAVRAYSVRRLNSSYTGAAMRIREAGGDTETDINFDSNGFVDLAAIESHCGVNAGYVKTWYDQSQSGGTGSGNDATQATPADQPEIYDGTSLRLVNGRLGVGSSNSTLLTFPTFTVSADVYIASVQQYINGNFPYGGADCFFFYSSTTTARFRGFGSDLNGTVDLRATGTQEAFGVVRSGTAAEMFWQGGSVGTVTASSNPTLRDLFDGQNQQTGRYNQSLQEFILWDADYSGNQASIDADINSSFLIYQPTDAPTSGLLATYTGAAAAYSVRQLSDKAVIALRVRRDSDDVEQNFGFDSNGDLDTAGIASFCGTANGYVTRWWDQSTNGNHADQATDASQPQIYNGTAVITEHGKPAVQGGSGVYLTQPSAVSVSDDLTLLAVADTSNLTTTQLILAVDTDTCATDTQIFTDTNGSRINGRNASCGFVHSTKSGNSSLFIGVLDYTNEELVARYNGSAQSAVTGLTENPTSIDWNIGANTSGSSNNLGTYQEVIIWLSAQSPTNATGIETNIMDYFSIT